MQKKFLVFILSSIMLYCSSCAKGISPYEAANGKGKCGRNYIK